MHCLSADAKLSKFNSTLLNLAIVVHCLSIHKRWIAHYILQSSSAISNSDSLVNTVPSHIPCRPPPPNVNPTSPGGAISSAPAAHASSSSLLGQVPAPATAPLIPPGATLLPAVLAYPTAYLPPTTASPQADNIRGTRFPQTSPPSPLFYPRKYCFECISKINNKKRFLQITDVSSVAS